MNHRQDADATEYISFGDPLSVPPIPPETVTAGWTRLNQARSWFCLRRWLFAPGSPARQPRASAATNRAVCHTDLPRYAATRGFVLYGTRPNAPSNICFSPRSILFGGYHTSSTGFRMNIRYVPAVLYPEVVCEWAYRQRPFPERERKDRPTG